MAPAGTRPAVTWFRLTELPLEPPAEASAPDGRSRIRLEIQTQPEENRSYTNHKDPALDWDKLPGRIGLRAWRAGDRLMTTKMKNLFQQARIASWDRSGWPVLVASADTEAERVIWARGFGPPPACAPIARPAIASWFASSTRADEKLEESNRGRRASRLIGVSALLEGNRA